MRKLIALSLAAVIGAGAVAATSSAASAHGYYGGWGNPYYGGYGYHRAPLAYFFLGTPFAGFGVRTPYFHNSYRYSDGYGNDHVAWCSQRYRTYNPATDTYFARRGVSARCYSPNW